LPARLTCYRTRRNRRRGNLETAESEHLRCRIACAHVDDGQASVVTRPSLAQIARSETARFKRAGGEIDRHDRRQSLRDRAEQAGLFSVRPLRVRLPMRRP